MHTDGTGGGMCLPLPPPEYSEDVCEVRKCVWTEKCVSRMSTLLLFCAIQSCCTETYLLCQCHWQRGKRNRKVLTLRF